MTYITKALQLAAVAAGLATAGPLSAQAAPFGPADATVNFNFAPPVSIAAPTGTAKLTGSLFAPSADGTLAGVSAGSGAGTINFSTTSGTTISDAVTGLFSFADGSGGFYTFDLATVLTTNFAIASTTKAIALFLIGTMGDANLGLTPTATSVTLTLNQTGTSRFSASASLANPPAPPPPITTPEPATLTLLGVGLFGLGMARRRSL